MYLTYLYFFIFYYNKCNPFVVYFKHERIENQLPTGTFSHFSTPVFITSNTRLSKHYSFYNSLSVCVCVCMQVCTRIQMKVPVASTRGYQILWTRNYRQFYVGSKLFYVGSRN